MPQKQPNAWKSGTPILMTAVLVIASLTGLASLPRMLVHFGMDTRPIAQVCTALCFLLVAEMAGWFDVRPWRCTGIIARLYQQTELNCKIIALGTLTLLVLLLVCSHDAYPDKVPFLEFGLHSLLYPVLGGIVLCWFKPLLPRLLYVITLGCTGTNDKDFHEELGISYDELFK